MVLGRYRTIMVNNADSNNYSRKTVNDWSAMKLTMIDKSQKVINSKQNTRLSQFLKPNLTRKELEPATKRLT